MNALQIGKAVAENYFFMRNLTKNFGDPVDLSDAECEKVFSDLQNDRFMTHRFAFFFNMKAGKLTRQLNIGKFLINKDRMDMEEYFSRIHPDYLADYIRWGQTIHSYAHELKDMLKPMSQTYRITLPLKLKDGKYAWVLQESMALQLDKAKNLITSLNIFSIARPFYVEEKIPLVGDLWDENFERHHWAENLRKRYFTRAPFILTPEQSRVMSYLSKNAACSNADVASALGKSKNTVDALNKQILTRARDSFPDQPFGNIRELAGFLKKMNLLQTKIRFPKDPENGNK